MAVVKVKVTLQGVEVMQAAAGSVKRSDQQISKLVIYGERSASGRVHPLQIDEDAGHQHGQGIERR